ncbi:GNAT family N-acetyltransferase [Nocardioides campestrisoli]|uniref:GNAT family N-acetyltransferase n=1 Tax=Nocardioides campestrisoli TaxID=2736757 RepID=UPI00163D7767|nr:GNAT family N-acetyltransferase [Nocardioides campestrisoli]
MTRLEFHHDPAAFLATAGEHLAAEPVTSTVVATFAARAAAEVADGVVQDPRDWYVVVRAESGAVTGAAMRTAPFAPRPLFVLPMPEESARGLARVLHARGEQVAGANGALPAVRAFAEESARLAGGRVVVEQHTRLFELPALVPPRRPAPGHLRAARLEEAELCLAWIEAFAGAADEQAGRPAGSHHDLGEDLGSVRRRIEGGRIWLWEDGGEVVHLTGTNPPAFGVVRVGPVYTPRERRGHGYASSAVAEVSRRILAERWRACLFTDQANPTSNAVYERLGYEPLVDMVNLGGLAG